MKILLLAAIVALLCVQALKASPTGVPPPSEDSEIDWSQYFGEEANGADGDCTYTTENVDGKTVITKNVKTTDGIRTYKVTIGESTTVTSEGLASDASEIDWVKYFGEEARGDDGKCSYASKVVDGQTIITKTVTTPTESRFYEVTIGSTTGTVSSSTTGSSTTSSSTTGSSTTSDADFDQYFGADAKADKDDKVSYTTEIVNGKTVITKIITTKTGTRKYQVTIGKIINSSGSTTAGSTTTGSTTTGTTATDFDQYFGADAKADKDDKVSFTTEIVDGKTIITKIITTKTGTRKYQVIIGKIINSTGSTTTGSTTTGSTTTDTTTTDFDQYFGADAKADKDDKVSYTTEIVNGKTVITKIITTKTGTRKYQVTIGKIINSSGSTTAGSTTTGSTTTGTTATDFDQYFGADAKADKDDKVSFTTEIVDGKTIITKIITTKTGTRKYQVIIGKIINSTGSTTTGSTTTGSTTTDTTTTDFDQYFGADAKADKDDKVSYTTEIVNGKTVITKIITTKTGTRKYQVTIGKIINSSGSTTTGSTTTGSTTTGTTATDFDQYFGADAKADKDDKVSFTTEIVDGKTIITKIITTKTGTRKYQVIIGKIINSTGSTTTGSTTTGSTTTDTTTTDFDQYFGADAKADKDDKVSYTTEIVNGKTVITKIITTKTGTRKYQVTIGRIINSSGSTTTGSTTTGSTTTGTTATDFDQYFGADAKADKDDKVSFTTEIVDGKTIITKIITTKTGTRKYQVIIGKIINSTGSTTTGSTTTGSTTTDTTTTDFDQYFGADAKADKDDKVSYTTEIVNGKTVITKIITTKTGTRKYQVTIGRIINSSGSTNTGSTTTGSTTTDTTTTDFDQYFGADAKADKDDKVSYTTEIVNGKTVITKIITTKTGTRKYQVTIGKIINSSGSTTTGSTTTGSTTTGTTATDFDQYFGADAKADKDDKVSYTTEIVNGKTVITKIITTKTGTRKYQVTIGKIINSSSSTTTNSGSEITVESGHGDSCEDGEEGGKHKPHYSYKIEDEDMELLSSQEIEETSDHRYQLRANECEKQLKELNSDNDNLTNQVIEAGKQITTITKEKSWVLGELEQCRDQYRFLAKDFQLISTEVKINKKKLAKAIDEYGKLQTDLLSASSESQNWKSKSESFEIEYKKLQEVNVQLSLTVEEYITKINNLQTDIKEMTIKSNKCGTESDEWKSKYDSERTKVTSYEKRIKELESSVADLKSKNDKLTDDLNSSRNTNTEKDGEIRTLKTDIDEYKSKVSTFTIKLGECNAALEHVTHTYNEDEKQDVQDAILRQKLELQVKELTSRFSQLEISYKTEITNVETCKNDIVVIHDDHAKACKKYEDDIAQLKMTFKLSLDKCETNVKSEKDINAANQSEFKKLSVRITEVEEQLAVSVKVSGDWEKKTQVCEAETTALKQSIETININLHNTDIHLSACVQHSNNLQTELTTVKSGNEECNTSLTTIQKKNEADKATIATLKNDIENCEAGRKIFEAENATLRCEVSQFLTEIESAEDKALKAILDIKGLFDGNKAKLTDFVTDHNIECQACEDGGPCLDAL